MRTSCLILASLTMLASAIVLYYLCSRAMGYSSPEVRAVYADAALPAAIMFGTGLISFTLCALSQSKEPRLVG
jgi:hypothetical protein